MQSFHFAICLASALTPAAVYATHVQVDEAEEQYRFLAGLFAEGHWELTVQEAEKFLAQYPQHARIDLARYRLAGALFELDRTAKALPHFRVLSGVSEFELATEVQLRLGQCELNQGNLDEAVSALRAATKGSKEYVKPHAYFLLGEALLQAKEYEEGAAAYQQSIALDPQADTVPHARRGLAWCHFRVQQWQGADQAASEFLKATPKHELASEVRFVQGEVHFHTGQFEEALSIYAAIPKGPYHELAIRGAGLALGALKRHRESGDRFMQLLDSYPASAYASEARIFAGSAYLKVGDPTLAQQVLSQPAQTKDPVLLFWRAKATHDAGDALAALKIAQEGLQHAKDRKEKGQLTTLQGTLLFQLGRPEEAASAFLQHETAYNLHGAATAFQAAGQPQKAQECAERLLQKFPASPFASNAHKTRLDAMFDQGEYAACQPGFAEQYQDAKVPESVRVHALSRYAWCAYLQEQWAESQKAFDRLVAQYPQSEQAEEAAALAGRSAFELGDLDAAQSRYAGYLERYPEGIHLDQVLYGAAQSGLGTEHLERLIANRPASPLVDDAHLRLGQQAEAAGEWDRALEHYLVILEQHKGELIQPAHYGWAWCQHKKGATGQALETLRYLLDDQQGGEWRLPALELQLWCAAETGDMELAQSSLAQLENGDWKNDVWSESRRWASYQKLTESARQAKDLQGAWRLLQQYLQKSRDPELQRNALVEAAWIALDTEQTEKAASTLVTAYELGNPNAGLAEASFFVGEAHFDGQQLKKAADWYARALNTKGSQVQDRSLYKLGFAQMRLEQFDKAAERFSELTQNHAGSDLFGESLYLAGECWLKAGQPAKAVAPLQALRKQAPKHEAIPRALFRLGQAQKETGKTGEAHETLATLVQTYGEFEAWAEAELNRGECLAALNRDREARAAFDRALKRDKGVIGARARLQIGQLHTKQGNEEDALAEFLKVALLYAHAEEVAEAMYRAGGCLERTEDSAAARKQYEQAASKHPKTAFGRKSKERLKKMAP